MSSADSRIPPVPSVPPTDPPGNPRRPLGWIATSNPFYVISAGLFLIGLRMSFGEQARGIDTWALMIGLGGYTLLLAAALLLVRFAGVWNDVRTVLLLVVLMFLATSATFDELLVMKPDRGIPLYLGGLTFSVLVTEVLLRGIRLRLPAGFRVPYYLVLGLFFLYPLGLVPVVGQPHSEPLLWGLFGFAPAAGLLFLTLLPAIHRGPSYVRDNGSPWPWPFYPWSLFVFLAVAVVGRSVLLCRSFHLLDGSSMEHSVFGPYLLVPFGFSLAVLAVELGVVARRKVTMWVGLALPVGLVVLAGTGHRGESVYREFLDLFTARLTATPLFLTVVAAGIFYGYAWLRDVPLATAGLTAALTGLAFVEPEVLSLADVRLSRPEAIIAPVVLQAVIGLLYREAWRLIAVAGVGAAWLTGAAWRLYVSLRAEVAGLDYLIVGLLLFPVAVLVSLGKAGVLARWLDRLRTLSSRPGRRVRPGGSVPG